MDIDDIRALVAVTDHGSVRAAARVLGVGRATVRRRIDALEARIGAPLLARGIAGAELTGVGSEVVHRGRKLIADAEIIASAARRPSVPLGRIRCAVPSGAPPHGWKAFASLTTTVMPQVRFDLTIVDDPLGLPRDALDLIVHFGPRRPAGHWKTTEIFRVPVRMMATRAYVEEHGAPHSLADALATRRVYAWAPPGEPAGLWYGPDGVPIEFAPAISTSSPLILLEMAASGTGIALAPEGGFGVPSLFDEPLVELLPGEAGAPRPVCASYRESLEGDPRAAHIIELLDRVGPLGGR